MNALGFVMAYLDWILLIGGGGVAAVGKGVVSVWRQPLKTLSGQ
ncbi:TPA: hypothetical protein ACTM63_002669 [Yersinia enterocolitica]